MEGIFGCIRHHLDLVLLQSSSSMVVETKRGSWSQYRNEYIAALTGACNRKFPKFEVHSTSLFYFSHTIPRGNSSCSRLVISSNSCTEARRFTSSYHCRSRILDSVHPFDWFIFRPHHYRISRRCSRSKTYSAAVGDSTPSWMDHHRTR